MGKLVTFFVVCALFFPAVPAALLAGGNQEASETSPDGAAAPDGSDERRGSPASEHVDTEERMKELLSEIGVRTFEEQIAAVDFRAPTLDGAQTRLSDHRGELVFLNFWATWCPPCREEMPAMDVMNDALSDVPFEMLALNVQEGRDQVSQFIGDIGTDFPILFDRSGRIASNYGVRGLPSTYFISPAGNVLGVLVGTRLWDEPAILDTIREAAELASDEDA